MDWLKGLLLRWRGVRPDPPCRHPNAVTHKWIADNTPWIDFYCPDCGFRDRGHVHGPVEGWVEGED